jgi:hypothetical protein
VPLAGRPIPARQILQIFMIENYNDKESYFYTANIKVATALATMGFAMKQPEPVTRMVRPDGKESTVFWFENLNEKGEKYFSIYDFY